MRKEIMKFRSWDGFLQRMAFFTMNDLCNWQDDNPEKPSALEEWMQYTGLHDKNGKEIYEGDIIELENWEPKRYEVVYDRGGFCLKFGDDSNFYPDIKYSEHSEVIGNVYQSPELLEIKSK